MDSKSSGVNSQGSGSININVSNLGKRFNREWIFRDLSQSFQSGNIYVIKGPNGSGKSTLLQVISGQIPPSEGVIKYESGLNPEIHVDEIFKHISYAAPYMDLIEEFTLREHIDFHFKLKKPRNYINTDRLLEILYLEGAADKQIGNFSSGMKQRVKLGLAFYTEAQIIFLDEPGSNLDKKAFDWYYDHLLKVDPNALIFIASNNDLEYPKHAKMLEITDYKKNQHKGSVTNK